MDDSGQLGRIGDSRAKIQLFLSYCDEDVETAKKVALILGCLDYDVWYAEESVQPGQKYSDVVNGPLKNCNTAIVLMGRNPDQDKRAQREIGALIKRSIELDNVVILPILLTEGSEIPELLGEIRSFDMRSDFDDGVIKLLEFLRLRFRRV